MVSEHIFLLKKNPGTRYMIYNLVISHNMAVGAV